MRLAPAGIVVTVVLVTACSSAPSTPSDPTAGAAPTMSSDPTDAAPTGSATTQRFPDVVDVEVAADGDLWRVDATISSPYDGPDRYADAFRVLGPDGTVLGVRELTHDHANEQPFTRNLAGVDIPEDVTTITVEGRDQEHGWGGATVSIELPR